MRYTTAVPMYVVTLPCNHEFRSVTRIATNMSDHDAFGIAGDEDPEDITWLYCQTCRRDYAMEGWELEEYQSDPRDSAGRRLSETRLAKMYDDAVIRDRIVAVLLKTRGSVSLPQVAASGEWTLITVKRVAADLRALSMYPAEEEAAEAGTPASAPVLALAA